MDQDNDLARLFTWLQTPELRYREFADAREISDAVVTWETRPNTAENPDAPVASRRNAQLEEEYPPDQFPDQAGVQVRLEPDPRGPTTIAPTPMATTQPESPSRRESVEPRGPQMAEPVPPQPSEEGQHHSGSPLDAVFGRLGGGRDSLPDPRERPRNIPGLGKSR